MRFTVFILICAVMLISTSAVRGATDNGITITGEMFTSSAVLAEEDVSWGLNAQDSASVILDFPKHGMYTFIALLRGEKEMETWPGIAVSMDADPVYSATVGTTNWASYTFAADLAKGLHEIVFEPDGGAAGDPDSRNLHLKSLLILSPSKTPPVSIPDASQLETLQAEQLDQWQEDAQARINQIRRGRLSVWVSEPDGSPSPKAAVTIKQVRHEFSFGTGLRPELFSSKATNDQSLAYRDTVKSLFTYASTGEALSWSRVEKEKGKRKYGLPDRMALWCMDNHIGLRAANLFCGCNDPAWLKDMPEPKVNAAIRKRAVEVATRFRTQIFDYDVVNEPLHCLPFERALGHATLPEVYKLFNTVNPDATLCINDYGILSGDAVDRYINYIRGQFDAGTQITGIGVQGKFTKPIDPIQLTRKLNLLSQLDLPIKITKLDCSIKDPELNAQCFEYILRAGFAHSSVNAILVSDFWSDEDPPRTSALLNKNFEPTVLGEIYEQLVFGEWWTEERGITDRVGRFETKAFFGDYEVEATTPDGRTINTTVTLSKSPGSAFITLHMPEKE